MESPKTAVKKTKLSLRDRGPLPRALFLEIQRDLNSFTERDREEYVAKEKALAAAIKARS